MISHLGVLNRIENIWSFQLNFGCSLMVWLVNERIHVNILEALGLATLAHLSLLHHRLKLLIRMRM